MRPVQGPPLVRIAPGGAWIVRPPFPPPVGKGGHRTIAQLDRIAGRRA